MVTNYDTLKPFFSIVIPTYNCAEFLQRALESVFSQTYQDFEVIVVDNSSTDFTQNVLNSYSEPRINIIEVENDGIIAYSRNRGIENAKGEWIAFLDSDDVWKPEKLEKIKYAIKHNKDVILFCHNEWNVVNGKRKNRSRYGPAGKNLYEKLIFKGNCLSTSAVCVRRDIAIKTDGFSERKDFITAEDYDFWIRLSQIGKFYFVNEVLGEWHLHGENDSIENPHKHSESILSVSQYHFDLWSNKYPGNDKKIRKAKSRIWKNSAQIMRKKHYFSDSISHAKKSILYDPLNIKSWLIIILSILRIKK